MKLYATVSSERATKGQGGQQFLLIDVKDIYGDTILKINARARDYVSADGTQEYLLDVSGAINTSVCHWTRTKAKK